MSWSDCLICIFLVFFLVIFRTCVNVHVFFCVLDFSCSFFFLPSTFCCPLRVPYIAAFHWTFLWYLSNCMFDFCCPIHVFLWFLFDCWFSGLFSNSFPNQSSFLLRSILILYLISICVFVPFHLILCFTPRDTRICFQIIAWFLPFSSPVRRQKEHKGTAFPS